MKVLFLDFDGVINPYGPGMVYAGSPAADPTFSATACGYVNKLLEEFPDLKIVVSSAWRHRGLGTMKRILTKNGIDAKRVKAITGNELGGRGNQIEAWLKKNPEVTKYVVLDDETSDMDNIKDYVVKVSGYSGLSQSNLDEAIEILKK